MGVCGCYRPTPWAIERCPLSAPGLAGGDLVDTIPHIIEWVVGGNLVDTIPHIIEMGGWWRFGGYYTSHH